MKLGKLAKDVCGALAWVTARGRSGQRRFIVDRRGEPAVVIMSVQDFIRAAAPPPDWLTKPWAGANGVDWMR